MTDTMPCELDRLSGNVAMNGYRYLASPYSRYPAGVDAAHRDICKLAARLFKAGIPVYSPIAHTHAIALTGGLDLGFEQWAAFDEAMIAGSRGMIVAMLDGWRGSSGIAAEIDICKRLGKPILYVDADLNFTPAAPNTRSGE